MPLLHFTRYSRTAINRSIYLGVLVLALLPSLITMATMYSRLTEAFTKLAYRQAEEVAQHHAIVIDDYLHSRLAGIKILAESNPPKPDRNSLSKALTQMNNAYAASYIDLALLTPEGLTISYSGPYRSEFGRQSRPWIGNFDRNGQYIGDVTSSEQRPAHVVMAIQPPEEQKWVTQATVSFDKLAENIRELRIGTTGQLCLINRDGTFLLGDASNFVPSELLATSALKRLEEIRNPSDRKAFESATALYGFATLKNQDWILVFQQRKEEALSGLYTAKETLTLTLGLLSLASLALGLLTARFIIDRVDKMEKEKTALNTQLIEASKLSALGELAAGIAHEINNPVAIMMEEAGWIEDIIPDLSEQSETTGEIARAATQIQNQGNRCRNITHKLLAFSRKSDFEVHPVVINRLIREMVSLSAQRALQANVEVILNLDRDLPPVALSPSEFQQVLLNLLNNAYDALQENGGTVRIASRLVRGEHIAITIADDGPGIPSQNLKRIFEPFFTTKPVGKGTGLGLSVCYNLVDNMGGSLTVQNGAGDKGAIFTILLPIDPNPKGVADAHLAATAAAVREAAGSNAEIAQETTEKVLK